MALTHPTGVSLTQVAQFIHSGQGLLLMTQVPLQHREGILGPLSHGRANCPLRHYNEEKLDTSIRGFLLNDSPTGYTDT